MAGIQKKILVIDDEEDMQKLLKVRLEQESFQVVTAGDGDIGLKTAEQELPDLIILDIMMPKVDGFSCLKDIRKLPKTKDIPILMLSGKEEEKVRDLFAFQKISGYIEKPFELDDLITKVKEILKI
ncbi:MAG: response regulator [Candidatus Gorgyraea atricola]|nr:response regulator [Candidatus Gorgyraea atricola]